jgi:RNA recognition motif-containing protein
LYVKGFNENTTEEDLRAIFLEYGEIESLRLHPADKQKKLYAFVCFKKPDEASTAKEKLHNTQLGGRTLTINHYEIKEYRQLQNEATEDKRGFQQFRQANSQSAKWTDLANQEELQYYLKLLIESMPMLMQQKRPAGPQGG